MIDPRAGLLLVGCVIFASLIYAELAGVTADRQLAAAAPASKTEKPATRIGTPALRTDELIATSLARPLFSPTRRPTETASGGDTSVDDLSDKRLTGIIVAAGHRLAIFAVNGGKAMAVNEGETVNGWRIERIVPDEISLSGPSGSRTLQPKADPNASRTAAVLPAKPGARPPPPPRQETAVPPPVAGGAVAQMPARPPTRRPSPMPSRGLKEPRE